MLQSEVEELVQKNRTEGVSDEEIAQSLSERGWSEDEIHTLLKEDYSITDGATSSELPDFGALIRESLAFFSEHYRQMVAVLLVQFSVTVLLSWVFYILPADVNEPAPVFAIKFVVFAGLALLVTVVNNVALTKFVLSPEISFDGAYRYALENSKPTLFISAILFASIIGGMVVFVVTGLLLAMFGMFSLFLFIEHGVTGFAALGTSKALVSKNFLGVAGRLMGAVLLVVVAQIPVVMVIDFISEPETLLNQLLSDVVTIFLVTPFTLIVVRFLYMNLQNGQDIAALAESKAASASLFKVFSVIGVVLVAGLLFVLQFLIDNFQSLT